MRRARIKPNIRPASTRGQAPPNTEPTAKPAEQTDLNTPPKDDEGTLQNKPTEVPLGHDEAQPKDSEPLPDVASQTQDHESPRQELHEQDPDVSGSGPSVPDQAESHSNVGNAESTLPANQKEDAKKKPGGTRLRRATVKPKISARSQARQAEKPQQDIDDGPSIKEIDLPPSGNTNEGQSAEKLGEQETTPTNQVGIVGQLQERAGAELEEEDEEAVDEPPPPSSPVPCLIEQEPPKRRKRLDSPTRIKIMHEVKKIKMNETKKLLAEKRRYFAKLVEPPDPKKMTMLDYIFYNPAANEMSSKDDDQEEVTILSSSGQKTLSSAAEKEQGADEEESRVDDPEASSEPAPRVMIGENGEIILDEASCVMERPNNQGQLSTEVVHEDRHSTTTYTSFAKRKPTKMRRWSVKETVRFYKAMSIVGTDFMLMSELFPNRSRADLKKKFKLEERKHKNLVTNILYNSLGFSICEMDDDDLSDDPELDEIDGSKKKPAGKRRGRRKKTEGQEEGQAKAKRQTRRKKKDTSTDQQDEVVPTVRPRRTKKTQADGVEEQNAGPKGGRKRKEPPKEAEKNQQKRTRGRKKASKPIISDEDSDEADYQAIVQEILLDSDDSTLARSQISQEDVMLLNDADSDASTVEFENQPVPVDEPEGEADSEMPSNQQEPAADKDEEPQEQEKDQQSEQSEEPTPTKDSNASTVDFENQPAPVDDLEGEVASEMQSNQQEPAADKDEEPQEQEKDKQSEQSEEPTSTKENGNEET